MNETPETEEEANRMSAGEKVMGVVLITSVTVLTVQALRTPVRNLRINRRFKKECALSPYKV